MKISIGTSSAKGLLINVVAAVGLLILISFVFFHVVLPWTTNKDKVVTVPDLTGMTMDEAIAALNKRDLRFHVGDSSYQLDAKPLTVIDQYPRGLEKVKINRTVDIALNAKIPPSTRYPDLTGSTYSFALKQLKTLELRVGVVTYRQDIAHNSILESRANGNIVQAGQSVLKGTVIDLVVGQDSLKLKDN